MGTGYTRNDTTNNIADGNVINAADLDGEFDAIVTALSTGGHSHDGTAAEGGPVTVLGPAQDFVVSASIVSPKTDNTLDLGTSTLEFKDLYLDGTAHIDTLDVDENANIDGNLAVGGNLTVTGTTTFNGGTITLGDAASDNVVFGADVDSSIIPDDDDTYDLGSAGQEWRDLYLDGTAHIDTLDVDINATIAGTLGVTGIATFTDDIIIGDGKTIGSASDVDAMTIASNGQITLTQTLIGTALDISGDIDVDGTSNLDIVDIDGAVDMATTLQVDGVATFTGRDIHSGGITIANAGQIGSVGDTDAIAIASDGVVTLTQKLVGTELDISGNIDVDGTTNLDVVDIDGAVNMATTALVTGVLTTTATQVATGGITSGSDIVSDTDSTDDLGTTSVRWANLFVDGITATDQITATGFTGTLDGILGSGAAAAATVTSLDTSAAVNLNLTTDSTSSTSGALIVDGGVGIAKKLFVGDDLAVTGLATIGETLAVTGVVTANAGVVVDNFTLDGTTLALSSGNFTLDVAGDIIFDGDGADILFKDDGTEWLGFNSGGTMSAAGAFTLDANGDIVLDSNNGVINIKDGGTEFLRISESSGDAVIQSTVQDKKIFFSGDDNGGGVNALILDMANAGHATFNADVNVGANFDVTGNAVIDGTALVTGVLTTTAKTVFNGGFGLPDSQKATFGGTGTGDLQIYHDGSDSIIADVGTGNLKLLGNDMRINNADSSQSYFFAANGGAASICHAGNTKIATASGGVTVTGEMAATTMDLSSNAVIDGTALVTGVLTTTAATVFNGGFAANQESTIIAADGAADNAFALIVKNEEATDDRSFGLKINAGSTATDTPFFIKTHDDGTELFGVRGSGQVRFVDGTASLPAISNIGDVNTGIFFPAADKIGLVTGGVERIRINDIGGVSVTSTAGGHFVVNEGDVDSDFRVESEINTHMLFVDGGDDYVSIGSADQNNGGALNINAVSGSAVSTLTCRSATDAHTNIFTMLKTPATSGNYTATASGDILGDIRFMGVNTSAVADIGAQIVVEQTGTASGTVPAQMSFVTNEATAMSINSAGKIGMGATGTNIDADLHVVGTVLVGTAAANTTIDDSLSTGLDVAVGSGTKAFQVWDDGNTTTPRLSVLRNGTLKSSVAGGFFETRTDGGGFIYKQLLDVATAGVTFSGQSTRGELGQVRILQTAEGADGGYIELKTSPSGSTTPALRVTVDAAGNVGIGTGAPSGYLATQLVVAAPDEGGITLAASATSHKQNIFFADGTSGSARNRGNLSYDHNNDSLSMGTAGGNARFLMDNTGAATIANGLTLTDGNLVVGTAGKGINFSAYGSGASIDNNLLNDYEEGTFAPAYAASGTAFGAIVHNTQVGNYTKVGNLVTISIALRTGSYTAGSTDGIVTITGLPFTSGGTDTYPIAINAQDAWTNFMPYQGWVANTTVTLTNNSGGSDRTGYRTVPVANMTAGANKNRIYLMGTYTTTS